MDIYLPHIHYTILVQPREAYTGEDTGIWLCERTNEHTSTLFITLPVTEENFTSLAHEMVHVLRNICIDREMKFELEQEHMAYIMTFALNKILGYKYED